MAYEKCLNMLIAFQSKRPWSNGHFGYLLVEEAYLVNVMTWAIKSFQKSKLYNTFNIMQYF